VEILKDQLMLKEVNNEDKLLDDLTMTELDRVEIVMTLEEEFNIELLDKECDAWVTVGDIVGMIVKKTITEGGGR